MMERGDPILCEEFSYFYMLDSVITAAGYKVLPVAMDEYGMKPEHLSKVSHTTAVPLMPTAIFPALFMYSFVE